MRLIGQFTAICVGGAALGLVLNAASGRPVALLKPVFPASDSGVAVCGAAPEAQHALHGHEVMPLPQAVAACNECTVGFVDARGAAAFAEGHIPGALHLPPAGHPDEAAALQSLRALRTIVIYDSGGGCGLAEGVADRLAKLGFKDVRLLGGSWTEWASSGGPAQSGACQACDHEAHASHEEPTP